MLAQTGAPNANLAGESRGHAWVTGAGTGIGRAVARRLGERGWNVSVSARTPADLESLAGEVPGRINVVPLDVTDPEAVAVAVETMERKVGPLDLVILNAGTYARVTATDFPVATFRRIVDVNLMGTVHCLAAVMPKLIARRKGHIAVVASVAGYVGLPSAAAYGASKAALITMCEALFPELAAQGVRLSLINPGFVDTPLTKKNDFPMPFLVSVDTAADHIMKGLDSSRFETVFPWRMAVAIRTLAALPYRALFRITRRMVRD